VDDVARDAAAAAQADADAAQVDADAAQAAAAAAQADADAAQNAADAAQGSADVAQDEVDALELVVDGSWKLGMFGDGSDGALTLGASGTTTLTRDMYWTNVSWPAASTAVIDPANWRVFVNGTLNLTNARNSRR
jgi:multidrug efflux pump subunit AcrA (membrane-fusion protein)